MATYQVGKVLITETGSFEYQVGAIFVVESQDSEIVRSEAHELQFSQDTELEVMLNLDVEQTLEFSHDEDLIDLGPDVEQTLEFSHETETVRFHAPEEVIQILEFSHEADCSVVDVLVEQTVEFSQLATPLRIVNGVERSEEHTVLFTDVAQSVFISVDAIPLDAESTIDFRGRASLPTFVGAFNNIVFSQTAVQQKVKAVEQTVEFSHDVALELELSRELESNLEFSQHYIYEIGDPELCFYAPVLGSGSFPAAPVLVKQGFVTLFHPVVSPTLTVQIRAPEFGDRDRLQHDKINRDTRGGSIKIFADETWPKLQILEMQFISLKETEAQAVLDFFEDTLGLEVGFTDWENRTWHGVIVSPDRELVRSKRNSVDISFEFEGELQ